MNRTGGVGGALQNTERSSSDKNKAIQKLCNGIVGEYVAAESADEKSARELEERGRAFAGTRGVFRGDNKPITQAMPFDIKPHHALRALMGAQRKRIPQPATARNT